MIMLTGIPQSVNKPKNYRIMNTTINIQTAIEEYQKLATIADAAKYLAIACEANNMTPEELNGIVNSLAKKQIRN